MEEEIEEISMYKNSSPSHKEKKNRETITKVVVVFLVFSLVKKLKGTSDLSPSSSSDLSLSFLAATSPKIHGNTGNR